MNKKLTILLVDDEQEFLSPVAFWLKSRGYIVKNAPDGAEALKAVKEQVPDIIFLDVKMPVMDGITALKHIREDHPDLPVFMITGAPEQMPRLENLKISGFFPKQGSLQQLENLLEPLLRIHEKIVPPKPAADSNT